MRQVVITKHGPPEVLQVRESEDPQAGDGQVRVRVRAAGINFADLSARVGLYPDAPKPPCVVGYEVSGTVDQLGANVSGLAPGDRVMAMPRFGGYTDTLVLPAQQVLKISDAMTYEEAAALPVAYLTAHHAMLFTGTLRRGMKVFIHSVAGGVGLAALELARAHGCVVYGTASPAKHAFLRERGCEFPIDSASDYVAEVKKLLGAESGLDLVLDPVGGRSWRDGYALLGPAGRLVAYGLSAAQTGTKRNLLHAGMQILSIRSFSPMKMMQENKSVTGVYMGSLFDRLDLLRPQLEALLAMYERGDIKPFVDRSFAFADAPAAHQYLHDRKARGKVLLTP